MKRREFISLLGGAAVAWPLAAQAQPSERPRHLGALIAGRESDGELKRRVAAFREELHQLGWTEGRNIQIDMRWVAPGDAEASQRFAKELVAVQPDVIVASTTPPTAALLQHTRTIPIIFISVNDPISSGFVASFPRPGGNLTGFVILEPTIGGKWLEMLKELAPHVERVALLFNPVQAPTAEYYLNSFRAAAASLAVEITAAQVRDASEIEATITALARQRNACHGTRCLLDRPSRADHIARIALWASCHLSIPAVRRKRRSDLLWSRPGRSVSASRGLRGSRPQGGEACRPAGPGARKVRACDQSQDRPRTWPWGAAHAARARRRGDRINSCSSWMSLVAVHESGSGHRDRC
jgi:ABC transporter substrate binding protein